MKCVSPIKRFSPVVMLLLCSPDPFVFSLSQSHTRAFSDARQLIFFALLTLFFVSVFDLPQEVTVATVSLSHCPLVSPGDCTQHQWYTFGFHPDLLGTWAK